MYVSRCRSRFAQFFATFLFSAHAPKLHCSTHAWGEQHRRKFPWRNTTDAYAILIAEFMLQKTNASLVAPLYEKFMEQYPTVEALAEAEFIDIKNILLPLGL